MFLIINFIIAKVVKFLSKPFVTVGISVDVIRSKCIKSLIFNV